METCTRNLRVANGLPIAVKGIPGVLEKSEADCLLGLVFLECRKCDTLFSRLELKLDSTLSVSLYHDSFEIDDNAIFRVVATETIKVQQATQQFFQHASQIGRNHPST